MKLKKIVHTLRTYTVHLPQRIKDYFLVLLLFFIIVVISQSLLTEDDEDF